MEAKCEYYLESGNDYVSHYTTVIRNGLFRSVLQEHVVLGDLIIFQQGDEICADIKLVECVGVNVNMHMLTKREQHYYIQMYGVADRLFHPDDIIFRNSFINSGNNF